MTNKEKRQYISNQLINRSEKFSSEFLKCRESFCLMPNILYKYRSFDEYTWDMIENEYVYLSPVKNLDDPFDCLSSFDYESLYNKKSDKLSYSMIDHIVREVFKYSNVDNVKINEMKAIASKSLRNGLFDESYLGKQLDNSGLLTDDEKTMLFLTLSNYDNGFDVLAKDDSIGKFGAMAMDPGDIVGVCSLSTKRDNKVMWSLYGDIYKGYCVQYKIPDNDDVRYNLCPVIYSKKANNNFALKLTDFTLNCMVRYASHGNVQTDISCLIEPFCTKDSDWSYQDEWRLIGDAGTKCKLLSIEAIYIGFNADYNNILRMVKLSKNKHFSVYFMNRPNGKKKITYRNISDLASDEILELCKIYAEYGG